VHETLEEVVVKYVPKNEEMEELNQVEVIVAHDIPQAC